MSFIRVFYYIFCCLAVFSMTEICANNDMNFNIYRPCEGNGSMCSQYIFADGTITKETPAKFKDFLDKNKDDVQYSPTIYFNSHGGSLISGLELARIIRDGKFNTHIGTVENVDFNFGVEEPKKRYKTILKKSECYSACAYAFLGGVSRKIDWDNAKYGIHQFYSGNVINEETVQVISSSLAIFLDDMGVSRRLLDLASFTGKNDIHLLDSIMAKELKVENYGEKKLDWDLKADRSGGLSICSAAKKEDSDSFILLCFLNIENKIIANIIYSPALKYRLNEVIDAFESEDEQEKKDGIPQLSMVFGNKKIPIKNKTDWKHINNEMSKSFFVTDNMLANLVGGNEFSIEAEFPNVYSHLDPSVTFSSNGLSGGIRALLK